MMAVVKISFKKHVKSLVQYVVDTKMQDDPVDSHNCNEQTIVDDFSATRRFHNGKGDINVIHIMQSWSAEESKTLDPKLINEMGRTLVETKFPGHAFVVVTHTDTAKTHNHILVNPWHDETGKKIENKKYHWHDLKRINDNIAKDRGLSVINGDAAERQLKLPEKVKQAQKFRGGMWLFDLCQKADFARHYATSYDEFVGIMGELGVKVRVEDKNISYSYSDKARAKRGSKLGRNYDKSGLEVAFKENDLKFANNPQIKEQLLGVLSSNAAKDLVGTHGGPANKLIQKDYSKFTKTERLGRETRFPHELDVSGSLIPVGELRKARNTNIRDYCKQNNIALEHRPDGKSVLKGKEFVHINDYEWVNTKNRTKGSLIELVAAHKNMSLLQAVAEINGNKRLLILEQHLGEVKRPYTSFYIPKEKQLSGSDAKAKVASLLSSFGARPDHAYSLMKLNQAQVDHNGVIKIFAKDDDGGAFEFNQTDAGNWQKKKSGSFTKPFFQSAQGGTRARVYLDPFSFLKAHGNNALLQNSHSHNVVCFMEPNPRAIGQFLAAHKDIRYLEIYHDSHSKKSEIEMAFFNNLKKSVEPFGISVTTAHSQDLGRNLDQELPSH